MGPMALTPQSSALLQKVALLDIAIGAGLVAYGLLFDNGVLALVGAVFAVVATSMFLVARSQRPDPEGPIVG